ncbi:unnamed protein product [Paramecium sonneborni]|uniref:Uncharacterized protein n=1 Tax=Paramecium sonneborni TaxID=65129 RepID=A0A8S1REN3_9CILI|nr:unnamed protein product [Paramecium sonneborni]
MNDNEMKNHERERINLSSKSIQYNEIYRYQKISKITINSFFELRMKQ